MAVFTLLLLAKYSLSPSHQIDYAAGVDGETVVVDMITNYHGPAVVSEFSIRQDHMFGECLARGHTLISCSADEYMHAEALVHVSLLWTSPVL